MYTQEVKSNIYKRILDLNYLYKDFFNSFEHRLYSGKHIPNVPIWKENDISKDIKKFIKFMYGYLNPYKDYSFLSFELTGSVFTSFQWTNVNNLVEWYSFRNCSNTRVSFYSRETQYLVERIKNFITAYVDFIHTYHPVFKQIKENNELIKNPKIIDKLNECRNDFIRLHKVHYTILQSFKVHVYNLLTMCNIDFSSNTLAEEIWFMLTCFEYDMNLNCCYSFWDTLFPFKANNEDLMLDLKMNQDFYDTLRGNINTTAFIEKIDHFKMLMNRMNTNVKLKTLGDRFIQCYHQFTDTVTPILDKYESVSDMDSETYNMLTTNLSSMREIITDYKDSILPYISSDWDTCVFNELPFPKEGIETLAKLI